MIILGAFIIMGVMPTMVWSVNNFVINTWAGPFEAATAKAFSVLQSNGSALDGIESGCRTCEDNQCDGTVGFGNHPDTRGHTSLDAMIMDGNTFDMGCVAYLRYHRKAISIARAIMHYTAETMLVGDGAEEFADMIGFERQDATTSTTLQAYAEWKANNCQPNFYENIPAAKTSCGPYDITPSNQHQHPRTLWQAHRYNHDTIGMVTIHNGSMACGTSTNGANHKVAGRVGDSPIPGAGCYVDSKIGGAAATGDGDVMMRFLPSYTAVLLMQNGLTPQQACQQAMQNIASRLPAFSGGIVCVNAQGEHAGAAHNMGFSYSYMADGMDQVQVVTVA